MIDTFQPRLPVRDPEAAAEIRERRDLDWFHRIEIEGHLTPGFPYEENWRFVAQFLRNHAGIIEGAEILEPGCADGLWTCWLAKLGAKHIDASDVVARQQFRLIARAFALPAAYYPEIVSTGLPKVLRRSYDVVASFGLLYHVHDPLSTLVMYARYLRPGGYLLLETAAIEADEAYLHYTGTGEIYGKDGGNQFVPTIGFLKVALDELGMSIKISNFRSEGQRDSLGKTVGRLVVSASKEGCVGVHHYLSLLGQLDMLGAEFPRQLWYDRMV